MFCSKCGKEINDEAVVCIHCGCATANYNATNKDDGQPIVINNNNSAMAAATSVNRGPVKRKYSLALDILMLFLTGGFWVIWMIFRPKYY